MKYLSLFSGVEAATLAWEPLGWEPMAFCEIEPFPSAVLAERWPDVPNLGDILAVDWEQWLADNGRPDVIVAGSPCQAFSVAGNRLSLEDARGNLTLFTAELVRLINPRVFLWENVPGALSTKDNAFGCFIGEIVGAGQPLQPTGKRWTNAGLVSGPEARLAWRVFDAQYFGVPQRRRRLFAARCPRDGSDPAAVLLERASLFGDPAPRRQERSRPAGRPAGGAGSRTQWPADVAGTLPSREGSGTPGTSDQEIFAQGCANLVPQMPQRQRIRPTEGNSETLSPGTRGPYTDYYLTEEKADDTTIMACAQHNAEIATGLCTTLSARQYKDPPIAFTCKDSGQDASEDQSPTLRSMNEIDGNANAGGQVAIGFYSTGGTHGVSAVDDGSPAVKVGSGCEIPSPPAVCFAFHENQRNEVITSEETAWSLKGVGGGKPGQSYPAIYTSDGETADPVGANEARTYTNEGGHNFRMHNVVGGFRPGQSATSRNVSYEEDMAPTLEGGGGGNNRPALQAGMAVRRLTPVECERLQGMPDRHTQIPWRGKPAEECPDGPRYKAIGNSMAVPVIRWLGRQIDKALKEEQC